MRHFIIFHRFSNIFLDKDNVIYYLYSQSHLILLCRWEQLKINISFRTSKHRYVCFVQSVILDMMSWFDIKSDKIFCIESDLELLLCLFSLLEENYCIYVCIMLPPTFLNLTSVTNATFIQASAFVVCIHIELNSSVIGKPVFRMKRHDQPDQLADSQSEGVILNLSQDFIQYLNMCTF